MRELRIVGRNRVVAVARVSPVPLALAMTQTDVATGQIIIVARNAHVAPRTGAA
jgi:hypothetical protein